VTSPLLSAQGEAYDGRYITRGELPRGLPAGRFGDLRSLGQFGNPQDLEGGGFEDARDFVTKTGGDTGQCSGNNTSRLFTARHEGGGLCLYGPHNPETRICEGVIARGAQGQFPDRFCLKIKCHFTTHVTKSFLPRMIAGGYCVKQNDTHGYSELCLSPEAAALAPEGLLQAPHSVAA
jgi:hypothetical protein